MSSPGASPAGHSHGHRGHDDHGHHHHHRHHRPVQTAAARPDRPSASLLALSLTARLAGAGVLTLVVWGAIIWAMQ